MIRQWFIERKMDWFYNNDPEFKPGGVLVFWYSLQDWWQLRPTKVKCDCCKRATWHTGQPRSEIYCNEYCMQTGPKVNLNEDEIPF